ncbi:MAG: DUF4197 domain-containing protein [Bacteroidia bacterium]|nr:DUF4197 domain-containing protein [Bacteroidia bacterium]
MKKIVAVLRISLLICLFSGCDTLQKIAKDANLPDLLKNTPLTNEEVIRGLRTALSVGTDTSVNILGKTNGYFSDALVRLALPPEAQNLVNNLSKIPGGSKLLSDAILAINRAAEDAAPQAKQIFVNAITGMSIADGFQILKGSNTAATEYLKTKTIQELMNAFTPRIKTSLSKPLVLGVSAETAYTQLIDGYNKASLNGVLFEPIKQNSLSAYTTQKALDGLFIKVADEERKIRQDPMHRISEILRRVFGS